MQVCISLQTDNHASTPPLKFFTGRMLFQQRQSTEGKSTEGKYMSETVYSETSTQPYHIITEKPLLYNKQKFTKVKTETHSEHVTCNYFELTQKNNLICVFVSRKKVYDNLTSPCLKRKWLVFNASQCAYRSDTVQQYLCLFTHLSQTAFHVDVSDENRQHAQVFLCQCRDQ